MAYQQIRILFYSFKKTFNFWNIVKIFKIGNHKNCIHAHFLPLESVESLKGRTLLHGHGLDYYFQGMYLPTVGRYLGGRSSQLLKLRNLGADWSLDFIYNVKYKVKMENPFSLMHASHLLPIYGRTAQQVQHISLFYQEFIR